MTLLRDVIEVPERVNASDFVVGLAQGVEHKKETLDTYVVTPQLVGCFDRALGLVSEALKDHRSQAAFLHGSFGSGKSHFMAVLYLLLESDRDARAVPELADVVSKHDQILLGKQILPLSFHMIGAESLEQGVFSGYVSQIRVARPGCDLPALHQSDSLLDNADQQRVLLGDDRFFETLNQAPSSGGFGGMSAALSGGAITWNAVSYQKARDEPQGEPRRSRLVSDLVRTMFPAFAESNQYIGIDPGLAVISRHAADLGFDAVVMFLDELILWLASHLGNREFVTNEGAKLAKLLESQSARRPIPLVSFVARQRDITEFLGSHVPGAERAAFSDVFAWSRGRFEDIRLEDRNLPMIVERRLLRPKDEEARRVIDDAFAQVDRRADVWDVLLTGSQVEGSGTGSDQEAFRRTYPFSPALVATLVALSQALQRERTALKVMLQLLVDGRDELEVSDLIPVGDLFDVLVDSQAQAVTDELKKEFETARRLYHLKLRRVLLDTHQLTEEQAEGVDAKHPFRTDDRLVKTLLLSALAPDVPALSGLTASRLAALNHGTIQTWIQGEEVAVVLQKMKHIAAHVGEIQVGEGDDPVLTVELTEVDYEGVIERAKGVDNEGNRRRALRELVWRELGVAELNTLDGAQSESVVWRGRKVVVDLTFGNVRDSTDLPDAALMAEGDRWKVVVDYPFDAEGQSPRSDLSRVESLQQRGVRSKTLFWIPAFLSGPRLEDLGTYVVLEHLLGGTGDRFYEHAQHLSPVDREQARTFLRQRRDGLREKLVGCIKQAYGAAARAESDIDLGNALDSPFATLEEGFQPQPPVGATLRDAFRHLIFQALDFAWPEHPRFEPSDQEVRTGELRRVLELCEEAIERPAGRLQIESTNRAVVRRICNTLEVGRFHENHLQLDPGTFPWSNRLLQAAARDSLRVAYPVSDLLGYLDEPEARGLERAMSGLILRVFALMQDLAWFRDGVGVEPPGVEHVSTAYELRQPRLPDEDVWTRAVVNARAGLGIRTTELRSAANVTRLAGAAREAASGHVRPVRDLERLLAQHQADLGSPDVGADRWATAAAVSSLLDKLGEGTDDATIISAIAEVEWPTTAAAALRCLETAEAVAGSLHDANWDVLRTLAQLVDDRRDEAQSLLAGLRDVAARDELAASLVSEIKSVQDAAIRLFTIVSPPKPSPPREVSTIGGSTTVAAANVDEAIAALRSFAKEHADEQITVSWAVRD